MGNTTVHWFRRDFRARDNTALAAGARESDAIVGVFVIDPRWFHAAANKTGAHQVSFWLESLRELETTLAARNIRLIVRTNADPVKELLNVARETGAKRITYNKEYEPDQMLMDERLEQDAAKVEIAVRGFKDSTIFEEEEILTGAKTIYLVFTPYRNAYLKKLGASPPSLTGLVPKMPRAVRARSEGIPSMRSLGYSPVDLDITPGEKAGAKMLEAFCANGLLHYKETRDIPALSLTGAGTSRLSAHLNAGTVSIRQAMIAAMGAERAGMENGEIATFVGELIWREFYRMILFNHPRTVVQPFQQNYSHVKWANDSALIDAWSEGRTGYPIVDAAMKQIRSTGFMHNRLRMITAMFLTKDLDVHWVVGERLFMRWLMDYDQASNVGGWQWAASTGTDAAPYFRVMNPVLQSERFDPDGVFIRHYLPALRNVPAEHVHAPWEMPVELQKKVGCVIGKDYPAPIVDHAVAKEKAIAKFRKRRGVAAD